MERFRPLTAVTSTGGGNDEGDGKEIDLKAIAL